MSEPATSQTRPPRQADRRFAYRLFGLEVASEIDLGELPVSSGKAPVDVEIVRADLPTLPNGALWRVVAPGEVLFDFPDIARLRVTDGGRIAVDTTNDATAALRWRLVGPAFGVLLHQRGALPLHATAVRIGGRVIGLVGASGAGKSTLAAALMKRGHALLIDDVSALTVDGGRAWLAPGSGRFRLLDDARTALDLRQGERLAPEGNKFELPAGEPASAATPLTALIDLAVSDGVSLDQLDPPARLALALRHTYCKELLGAMKLRPQNFAQCSALAGVVPAYRLARPFRFEAMNEAIERLEDLAAARQP